MRGVCVLRGGSYRMKLAIACTRRSSTARAIPNGRMMVTRMTSRLSRLSRLSGDRQALPGHPRDEGGERIRVVTRGVGRSPSGTAHCRRLRDHDCHRASYCCIEVEIYSIGRDTAYRQRLHCGNAAVGAQLSNASRSCGFAAAPLPSPGPANKLARAARTHWLGYLDRGGPVEFIR